MFFKSANLTKVEQNQNQDLHQHVSFSNHTLKLKAPDQLQSEGEESLLSGDIK